MTAIGLPMPDIGNVPSAFCRYELEVSCSKELQSDQSNQNELHNTQHSELFTNDRPFPEHVVCADPVHLLADKDNARLVPSVALDIQDAEAIDLIDSLNDLIRPDGLNVVKGHHGQWFLTGMDASALDSWRTKEQYRHRPKFFHGGGGASSGTTRGRAAAQ